MTNRVIKFRAWDRKNKRYAVGGPFSIVGEVTMFDLLQQYRIEEYDDLVIEQFTGLQDKNGKDIYDGDLMRVMMPAIIRQQEKWDGNEVYYVDVEESPAAELIAEVCINPKHTTLRVRKVIAGDLATKSTRLKIRKTDEIIGNIHENPDLLS